MTSVQDVSSKPEAHNADLRYKTLEILALISNRITELINKIDCDEYNRPFMDAIVHIANVLPRIKRIAATTFYEFSKNVKFRYTSTANLLRYAYSEIILKGSSDVDYANILRSLDEVSMSLILGNARDDEAKSVTSVCFSLEEYLKCSKQVSSDFDLYGSEYLSLLHNVLPLLHAVLLGPSDNMSLSIVNNLASPKCLLDS
jgi:hypothetical protein